MTGVRNGWRLTITPAAVAVDGAPWPKRGLPQAAPALGAAFEAIGVDLAAVVLHPRILVVQQMVGGRHLFEALSDRRLPGMQVGMKLLGELAIGGLDGGLASGLRNAKNSVKILHNLPESPRPAAQGGDRPNDCLYPERLRES